MYLYGAGGHCKAIIDIIVSDLKLNVSGIYDHSKKLEHILGYPITHTHVEKLNHPPNDHFHICIGDNATREAISKILDVNYPVLTHPTSFVSTLSVIGEGTSIMPLTSINAASEIGKHCIINAGAIIGHDVIIGDYSHIAPNSSVAGFVTMEKGVHFGIGASVIQGVHIGKWAVIGAGAVVIKDVPDYAVVVGNPGRVIKFVEKHKTYTP
jgi:sugar O-acyltransferase (sialic acid O-acetyltransferase NeuD family)